VEREDGGLVRPMRPEVGGYPMHRSPSYISFEDSPVLVHLAQKPRAWVALGPRSPTHEHPGQVSREWRGNSKNGKLMSIPAVLNGIGLWKFICNHSITYPRRYYCKV